MYLFVDTETGGLTPQHSLLTVSCIVADGDLNVIPIGNQSPGLYMSIAHEQYNIAAGALAVNGIDLVAHNKSALPVPAAKQVLLDFIRDALRATGKKRLVPAGHNVAFDVQFLQAYLLTAAEWDEYFTYPALDTAAVARFYNAAGRYAGGYSLGKLRDRFMPHDAGQSLHNAEIDNLTAITLAKKFVSMVNTA